MSLRAVGPSMALRRAGRLSVIVVIPEGVVVVWTALDSRSLGIEVVISILGVWVIV